MSIQRSRILKFQQGYRWNGVDPAGYKSDSAAGRSWQEVARHVLIGDSDEVTHFQVRYFEVAPGGYSSLEKHGHAHAVIILRGQGKVIVGETAHEVQPLDVIYIAPWTPHQFLSEGNEPFGFLCIVDATRDRPQLLTTHEQTLAIAAGAKAPYQKNRAVPKKETAPFCKDASVATCACFLSSSLPFDPQHLRSVWPMPRPDLPLPRPVWPLPRRGSPPHQTVSPLQSMYLSFQISEFFVALNIPN